MTTQSTTALLAEFPPVSQDDWRKLVEAELKGAPFDKKMFTATHEGITLKPIYRREDVANLPHVNSLPGFAPFVRGANASGYVKESWDVSQEIAVASPTEFNFAARNSISRGLNALNMVLDRATRNGLDPDWAAAEDVGFGGLSIASLDDLNRALDGVDLEQMSLFVRSGASALPFAALLIALAKKRKKSLARLHGCIEMDPLGVIAHEGKLPQSFEGAYREMAALTEWAAKNAPQLQTICVHSRAWHEAGGSAVQELAYTLATGVEYLRQLAKLGLGVNIAAPRIRFAVTVGTSFFLEIAKLRALRMLWSRAVAAAGGDETAQKISLHVRTSQWNKSVVDPYNNMLRTTVEAFAGVLGGCDSMQVGAFDEVLRTPDDFSLRIARNTQLVLQKECELNHVVDPAGGAWYVENATAEIAARAWALFQEVEKAGGMEAVMRAGVAQKSVAETAAKRIKAVTSRRDSIVGVNQYANPKEKPLEVVATDARAFHKRRAQQVASHRTALEDEDSQTVLNWLAKVIGLTGADLFGVSVEAVSAGATLGEITRALRINDTPSEPITPVCITRAAKPIEGLRAAMNRRADGPAKVFLCNMGTLKEHKARADFSRGFFSVGGYDVVSPAGFKTPEDAVAAFAKSGADIAVLCSVDDNYPALVPALTAGIRSHKPGATIVLAGYPAEQIETHKQAGVDEFIHIRADVLEVLSRIHERLGIR
ncbi:MAG: acyl-CoA mutase large subunit family protein [Verrucomicrobiae bacterium]|nr:acyl-CoA mutase large subunit family protein [Verrucomicrobiae bacterium]